MRRQVFLHTHTYNSLHDSGQSENMLVNKAAELGASAIALTDHGNMMGIIPFVKACEEKNIKPICGVEAYVDDGHGRRHLILMAKDFRPGYTALANAVTASNENIYSGFPRMNADILNRTFGEGTPGHGHVIATSACISGVLAGVYRQNDLVREKLRKIESAQKNLRSPESVDYKRNLEARKTVLAQIAKLDEARRAWKKASGAPTKMLETKIRKYPPSSEEYKAAKAKYDAVMADKTAAPAKIAECEKKKEELIKGYKEPLQAAIAAAEKEIGKWQKLEDERKSLAESLIPEGKLDEEADSEAIRYDKIFGHGNFFIELQYHGMKEEADVFPRLARIAKKLGIPVVAANDAHMPDNSPESILTREIMRTTRFNTKYEHAGAADKELYLKTNEQLAEWLGKILDADTIREAIANTEIIADMCNVEFPKETHYPSFQTPDGSTPEQYLWKEIVKGSRLRYPGGKIPKSLLSRLAHEYNVICSMNYASYHLIVADLLDYADIAGKLYLDNPEERALALTFDKEKIRAYVQGRPGETKGPGRGSAAGSYICWLLSITQPDPIKNGLYFERFLNPERVSMPDIDTDIAPEVRPYVIAYVSHKYGKDCVCGIATKGVLASKSALRTAARALSLRNNGEGRTMDYMDTADKISADYEALAKEDKHATIKTLRSELISMEPGRVSADIVTWASLIEGCVSQFGQHAAGIIITDGMPVRDWIPLIWNEKNQIMCTQCDMVQAEEIGLLKIDFLGLKNLGIITEALRNIQKDTGEVIDLVNLKCDPEVMKHIYCTGNTVSVFQFESAGMQKLLKEFRPERLEELGILNATYRPGPKQFIPDMLAVKKGLKQPEYVTEKLEPILAPTYGAIIYQEQVQEIFKKLAGYSYGQADLVRRAMAKKKEKVLLAERGAFIHGDAARKISGCAANGISEAQANALFDQMTKFAEYAFNKAHAVSYAFLSYQTAWLKHYYPAEYEAAVISNNDDVDKMAMLVADTKAQGVSVLVPDVNRSELKTTVESGAVRLGFSAIKGLPAKAASAITAARENGPFESVPDLLFRTRIGKSVYELLVKAGALDSLCGNRAALFAIEPALYEGLEAAKKSAERYERSKTKKPEYVEAQRRAERSLYDLVPDTGISEDQKARLIAERGLLGAFISQDLLDLYPAPERCGAVTIADARADTSEKEVCVSGIVTGLRILHRKADGIPFAAFTLTDRTGSVQVMCFAKQYAEWGSEKLSESAALILRGRIEDNGRGTTLYATSAGEMQVKTDTLVFFADQEKLPLFSDTLRMFREDNGHPFYVYDAGARKYRPGTYRISARAAESEQVKALSLRSPAKLNW